MIRGARCPVLFTFLAPLKRVYPLIWTEYLDLSIGLTAGKPCMALWYHSLTCVLLHGVYEAERKERQVVVLRAVHRVEDGREERPRPVRHRERPPTLLQLPGIRNRRRRRRGTLRVLWRPSLRIRLMVEREIREEHAFWERLACIFYRQANYQLL